MNYLEQAKELKRRFDIWKDKREGFNIKKETKELKENIINYSCGDVYYFLGKKRDYDCCSESLCPGCKEAIRILDAILGENEQ